MKSTGFGRITSLVCPWLWLDPLVVFQVGLTPDGGPRQTDCSCSPGLDKASVWELQLVRLPAVWADCWSCLHLLSSSPKQNSQPVKINKQCDLSEFRKFFAVIGIIFRAYKINLNSLVFSFPSELFHRCTPNLLPPASSGPQLTTKISKVSEVRSLIKSTVRVGNIVVFTP